MLGKVMKFIKIFVWLSIAFVVGVHLLYKSDYFRSNFAVENVTVMLYDNSSIIGTLRIFDGLYGGAYYLENTDIEDRYFDENNEVLIYTKNTMYKYPAALSCQRDLCPKGAETIDLEDYRLCTKEEALGLVGTQRNIYDGSIEQLENLISWLRIAQRDAYDSSVGDFSGTAKIYGVGKTYGFGITDIIYPGKKPLLVNYTDKVHKELAPDRQFWSILAPDSKYYAEGIKLAKPCNVPLDTLTKGKVMGMFRNKARHSEQSER
ncbi:MAG: hypothetical protein LBQ18_06140 [Campylobacteraceae bacterium]|jgi:hypothetical protein|nr:hypothetical protein [Campylobacteraceae bacterium]